MKNIRYKSSLSILQYNVMKSKDIVMAPIFRDPRITEYDILSIQEPWRNPFSATTHHPLKDCFHLVYPEEDFTRVCFPVNKNIKTSLWTTTYSANLCTIALLCTQKSNKD